MADSTVPDAGGTLPRYTAACDLHPHVIFPVRMDRLDADEDKISHAHTPGGHTLRLLETDVPAAERDGFPPAGYARELLEQLGALCARRTPPAATA